MISGLALHSYQGVMVSLSPNKQDSFSSLTDCGLLGVKPTAVQSLDEMPSQRLWFVTSAWKQEGVEEAS